MRIAKLALLFSVLMTSLVYAQAQWSPPVRISEQCQAAFQDMIVSENSLHVIFEGFWGSDRQIIYLRSTDNGDTWPISICLAYRDSSEIYLPVLINCGSKLICFWHNFDTYDSTMTLCTNIVYTISDDNGLTWSPRMRVLDSNWDTISSIDVSCTDTLINLTFFNCREDGCHYFNVRSTDSGQFWSTPRQITGPLRITSGLDQVSYGHFVHVVGKVIFPGDSATSIAYLKSTDDGLTWGDAVPLSDAHYIGLPSLAVNQSGKLGVFWMEQGNIFLRLSNDSGSTWTPTRQLTYDNMTWTQSDIVLDHDLIALAWEGNYHSERIGGDIIFNKGYNDWQYWEDPDWLDLDRFHGSRGPALAVSKGKIFAIWEDIGPDHEQYSTRGLYFSRWPFYQDNSNDDTAPLPSTLTLFAYPNPFNSSTTLCLNTSDETEISIYDITGKLVKILKVHEGKAVWDATGFSSGLYFARAQKGISKTSIKLILLK